MPRNNKSKRSTKSAVRNRNNRTRINQENSLKNENNLPNSSKANQPARENRPVNKPFRLNAQSWPTLPMVKVDAPTQLNPRDPRILGIGTSKMVWLDKPDAKRVVVNSLNSQIFDKTAVTDEIRQAQLEEKKASQIGEYHFSNLLYQVFPGLIPRVYSIPDGLYHPTNRFRYWKDFCEPVVKNEALFHKMIQISDYLVDQGWVYLDMKPDNLGVLNGEVVLIDTDPTSFYMFPDRKESEYYKNACRAIILLFTFNYIRSVPPSVLHDYVVRAGLTKSIFREVFRHRPTSPSMIAKYNNDWFDLHHLPIKLDPENILEPDLFIHHYGNAHWLQRDAWFRLYEILEYRE